ncbi:MAG: hypothetical protein ISR98_02155 [Parcubacteria group bacterium]|nr:hypothetical protein [Parcubacteria group bacterium]
MLKLKDYLRKLKTEVEKDGFQKSDKWELYQDLYKIQVVENKHYIKIYIVERNK